MDKDLIRGVILVFLTCVSFASLVSSNKNKKTGICCLDGLGLNYTLPMFNECKKKLHSNGSMVQTIPKLIPYTSAEAASPRRKSKLGIPPGHRVCRFPDCGENPCRNGWCEETMKNFKCHCSAGNRGKRCKRESNTKQDTTTMSTTESTTSHPTTTTHSSTTQDTTTMSTTESTTSHLTTTTPSTISRESTTNSISDSTTPNPTTTTNEIEGGIRLVDGDSSDEGRVEIFHEGKWGTICLNGWDYRDARVVCRQLGYSGKAGAAWSRETYGPGSGPIHLEQVDCSGSESRLTDCSNGGWDNHICDHSEDAGVSCVTDDDEDLIF